MLLQAKLARYLEPGKLPAPFPIAPMWTTALHNCVSGSRKETGPIADANKDTNGEADGDHMNVQPSCLP